MVRFAWLRGAVVEGIRDAQGRVPTMLTAYDAHPTVLVHKGIDRSASRPEGST